MGWTKVVTSGHEVAVAEKGATGGPAYVLVHGIGVSARYYAPLATRLAGSGHVVTPDLPGFGRSPRPRQPLSVAELARVVADVIADRELSAPVVVGHSMGAQVVTEFAAAYPGLVERVVLLGPVVRVGERRALWQAARLMQSSLHEPARLNALMAADYARCGLRWYGASMPHMLEYRIEDRLRSVTARVVVARGANDSVAPRSWTRHLASVTPNGRQVDVAGAGHAVMYSHPDRVAALCRGER